MCAVWVGGRLKCRGVAVLNRISGLRSVVVVEWLSFGGRGKRRREGMVSVGGHDVNVRIIK